MRFFNLEQGSPEWLEWRQKGIGASDTPIIMGLSPFSTPLQLYNDKKGITQTFHNEWATKKGHLMEPTARMFYQNMTGIETVPVTVAHDKISYLKASLDGWSDKKQILVEIKFPGKKDWDLAMKGEIPDYYQAQIQHQMLVTDTEKAHYYAFNGEHGRLIVCHRDAKFQAKILLKASEFMERLRLSNPPPLTVRDTKQLSDDTLSEKVDVYRKLKSQIKMDTETLKALEQDILKYCDHPKCEVNGLKVIKYTRKGSMDWAKVKKLPELENLDLEHYRKDDIEIVQFRDKGENDAGSRS